MDTFDFPYHTIGDEYPESSTLVRFGRGYQFASKPNGPDQIIFHLVLSPLFWWLDADNNVDWTANPRGNAGTLQKFYETQRLYNKFYYPHPTRGTVVVRFHKPIPPFRSIKDAVSSDTETGLRGHQIEPVNVDLILQP